MKLDEKYILESGDVYITGTQAILLMMMRQRRFDRARGYRTAGFFSGYRGSPLGSVDSEAWRAEQFLANNDITFVPGVNEDLALTSVWGSQQVALDPEANVDGVFGLWYGKGAGLDRCGDVLRHAHGAGASAKGGVLIVSGDDHALKSSSQAYHSEPTFIDMQMPVLYPSSIQEMLDYAILGWEMSRFSGCYVGFKVLAEHVNSTASVSVSLDRISIKEPTGKGLADDRWIRWPDPWPDVERRIHQVKLPAAAAFARANGLDQTIVKGSRPRIGIVTAGKSYHDVLQALSTLGISRQELAGIGISIYKIGMPWPLDIVAAKKFCVGHEIILVVEEKRDIVESQIKNALYELPDGQRPKVIGRRNEDGEILFSNTGELTADNIARVLGARITAWHASSAIESRLALLETKAVSREPSLLSRTPYFCSGCPHNTSTKVPQGSRALAGVGCHFMAVGMGRNTETFTQMGGEGATWIGTAPFTATDHVFVNLGEGTYFHSGSLAIRAAIAAKVNITYKILFNDAVAMTGGQPVDGEISVASIVNQLRAEGVKHIEVVGESTRRLRADNRLPSDVKISSRDNLDEVQRRVRSIPGVSVIVYDQVCATEKRRRRKRSQMPPAGRKVFINELVCEGCGDCSVQSNCLSVLPIETELGRKRTIDQSSCNQDYSCIEGFCPSFVTIAGGSLKKQSKIDQTDFSTLPRPSIPKILNDTTYNIVVAGIGGSGVVTIGAILGMAAHIEGKKFSIHDKLGMAQKFGSVHSHIRIAEKATDIQSVRIGTADANLVLGGDLTVSGEADILNHAHPKDSHIVVATEQAITGEFIGNADYDFKTSLLQKRIEKTAPGKVDFIPAGKIALATLGDGIGMNMFLLGYAWQKGLIPLESAAIGKAIELNGVAIELNHGAFELGRYWAHFPGLLENWNEAKAETETFAHDLKSITRRRVALLTDYQNAGYAERYSQLVDSITSAEKKIAGKSLHLSLAVAQNFAKLMAYKDEYEVARLYSNGWFRRELKEIFSGEVKLSYHLAPPFFAKKDPVTGHLKKRAFRAWVTHAFALLARLKVLRGTRYDPFGASSERRAERELVTEYESDLRTISENLTLDNLAIAVRIAKIPEKIRGFGHVKAASIEAAGRVRKALLMEFKKAVSKQFQNAAE